MGRRTVEIDMDIYLDLLEERREHIIGRDWIIPDAVWNYVLELIEDVGVDPTYSAPSYVVDNIAVNGDYGPVSDYSDLLDEIKRVEDGEALFLFHYSDGEIKSVEDAYDYYDSHLNGWMKGTGGDEADFLESDEYYNLCIEIGVCYSLGF